MDPLDHGAPALKRWHEFRLGVGTALLLSWLVRELRHIEPEYEARLASRLESSMHDYPDLLRAQAEDEYDGEVPVHTHDEHDILFWAHEEFVAELYRTLFPFGEKEALLGSPTLALVVVSLHSALEAYAKAVGVTDRGSLPESLRLFLESHNPPLTLDSRTFDVLLDADAIRHIVIHNRGIVDDAYLRRVHNPPFQLGERRVISAKDVDRFGRAIMTVARRIREADHDAPAT